MRYLLSIFGTCRHARISWPMGPRNGKKFVQCLDCCQRLEYDWSEMRITRERE